MKHGKDCSTPTGSLSQSSQSGGIVIFVAITIGVLIMFVAVVVDTHMSLVQREQSSYYARLAALTAIESFMDSRSMENESNQVRYNKAITVVNENLASTSTGLIYGGNLEVVSTENSGASGLRLEPGTWAVPSTCDRATNVGCDPVFTPVAYSALNNSGNSGASGNQVNAFRIIGSAPGGLTPISRAVFGGNSRGLGVSVVAAAIPRRGVFLVDVSSSSVGDSHQGPTGDPTYDASIQQSMYAFPITQLTNGASEAARMWNDLPDWRDEASAPTDYSVHYKSDYSGILENRSAYQDVAGNKLPIGCTKGNCFLDAGSQFKLPPAVGWGSNWDIVPTSTSRGTNSGSGGRIQVVGNDDGPDAIADAYKATGATADSDLNAHSNKIPLPDPNPSDAIKKRYVRARSFGARTGTYLMRDENGARDDDGQYYLIDRVSLSAVNGATGNPPPSPPQPLTSILSGLNAAVGMFDKRRVAGDQAGIIFFDQFITWNRTATLSSRFNFLKQITNLKDPASRHLVHRMGVFPGVTGYTDLPSALQEGLGELVDPVSGGSTSEYLTSDFIAFIGDGLTNCQPCSEDEDMESNSCTDGGGFTRCLDQYDYYRQSMIHMGNVFNGAHGLIQNHIQFHVFLVGSSVMPHTVDMRQYEPGSGENLQSLWAKPECGGASRGMQCQSEQEFRDWYQRAGPNLRYGNAAYSMFHYVSGYVPEWSGGWDDAYNFNGKNPNKPFYQANLEFYVFSAAANGLWAPIRPRDDAACNTADAQNYRIDKSGSPSSLKTSCMVPPCELWTGSGYAVHTTFNKKDKDGNVVPTEVNRIRTKDPYCRTAEEQMQDYMQKIFNSNPYSVVQTEGF